MNFPYLYSNPSGSGEPIAFSLVEVFKEFPGRQVVTNEANNAVGLISLDRPYSLPIWSTVATGQWTPGPYPIVYGQPSPVHGCVVGCGVPAGLPMVASTPEPSAWPVLGFTLVLVMWGRKLRRRTR